MDYPINLDLQNKKVLIVGGGEVAFRKFKRLLLTEAEVTVVSLEFDSAFNKYLKNPQNNYTLIKREFEEEDLKDKFLVIAATDNEKINENIALLAGDRKILVNIVDNESLSDFTVPAAHYKGDLLLTASTNSKLPALSKKIRKDLEKEYGIEYELLLAVMSQLRGLIIQKISDIEVRKKIFHRIAGEKLLKTAKNIIEENEIDELDIETKSNAFQKANSELTDKILSIIEDCTEKI